MKIKRWKLFLVTGLGVVFGCTVQAESLPGGATPQGTPSAKGAEHGQTPAAGAPKPQARAEFQAPNPVSGERATGTSLRDYSDKQMACTVNALRLGDSRGQMPPLSRKAREVRKHRRQLNELMACVRSDRSSQANLTCWLNTAQSFEPEVAGPFLSLLAECGDKARWDQQFTQGSLSSAYEDSLINVPPKLLAMQCRDSCMNSPLVTEPCYAKPVSREVVKTCRTRVHYCNQLQLQCADNRQSWEYSWRTAYYSWLAAESTLNRLKEKESARAGATTVLNQWPVEEGVSQEDFKFLIRERQHHSGKGTFYTVDVLRRNESNRYDRIGVTGPMVQETPGGDGAGKWDHYRANLSGEEGTKSVRLWKDKVGDFCTVQVSWNDGFIPGLRQERSYRARGKCPRQEAKDVARR